MAMIGMSPWAAAAGGLAGGLGQGILTGVDLAQRRRQEEAQKQRDAMSLLITGFKHLSDDPDALKQFTQWLGQTTGMPVPPWVGTTTDPGQRLMGQYQKLIAAGATPAQADAAVFGIKAGKPPAQHALVGPNNQLTYLPPGIIPHLPQAANQPIPYFDPSDPQKPPVVMPPHSRPLPSAPGTGKYLVTNTETGQTYQKTLKPGESLAPNEQIADKRNQEELIEKKALARITGSIFYKIGSPTEQADMLKAAKDEVRKELQPWLRMGTNQQGGNKFAQMPDAAQYKGRTITDDQTGKKYKSDGSKWVSME